MIRLVEDASLPIRKALRRLDIRRSTCYNWWKGYREDGVDGLEVRKASATLAG
ncbi:MAG: helix-turn-helix domain-containing protein, partial [Myxococcales bacterium]|nr:helix-turn-helix domain-containing protein [Myxococcales bacterium]